MQSNNGGEQRTHTFSKTHIHTFINDEDINTPATGLSINSDLSNVLSVGEFRE